MDFLQAIQLCTLPFCGENFKSHEWFSLSFTTLIADRNVHRCNVINSIVKSISISMFSFVAHRSLSWIDVFRAKNLSQDDSIYMNFIYLSINTPIKKNVLLYILFVSSIDLVYWLIKYSLFYLIVKTIFFSLYFCCVKNKRERREMFTIRD